MGATDHTYTYQTDDRSKVAKSFKQSVPDYECDIEDEGNGYCGCPCQFSGAIGRWHSDPFATEREATEWVLDNTDKREAAAAAAFYIPAKLSERGASKRERLAAKLTTERTKLSERITTELDKLLGAKSKTVTCSGCSSRLSRAHLKGRMVGAQLPGDLRVVGAGPAQAGHCGCPLCATPLLSASALKSIASARSRTLKAEQADRAARKPAATKKVGYVVGGWAAS
jgi:hypothetical protein